MELSVEINNIAKSPVRNDFFAAVAKETIKKSREKKLGNKKISISIALVGEKKIKEINKIYRKKNEITDVLSFSEYPNPKELARAKEKNLFLGELIICYDDIRKHVRRQKIKTREELARVISHGTLHLLGFKHGEKMFAIQNMIAHNHD